MFFLLSSLAACGRWAVLMAGSSDWYNYRHQADIATLYDLLINRSFPPEHIITVAYDDEPYLAENPYRGKLFHNTDHHNFYHGSSKIDYAGAKVTVDALYNIISGEHKEHGKVLESTEEDDVFIYYDNHGADGALGVPEGAPKFILFDDLGDSFKTMYNKKMYKRLLFMVEAYESGNLPKYLPIPNAVVITAAKHDENSWAAIPDAELDNMLSDEFTFAAIDLINKSDYTIDEFYQNLVKGTTHSTPQIGGGGYPALKDTHISAWFGEYTKKPEESVSKPRPKVAEAIPQREVLRHYLKHRTDLSAMKQLHELDANTQKTIKKFEDIAYLLNINNLQKVQNPTDDHYKCFFDSMRAFSKKYGTVHPDDMGLTRKLLDMCAVRPKEMVIKAIEAI